MEALFKLAKRQSDEEEEDDDHCPTNFDDLSQADPIVGGVTLHRLLTYVSISCVAVTLLVSGYLISGQVFNYREPRVQKQYETISASAILR